MDNKEFISFRLKLNTTQKQMAELIGKSLRAVQSFEQGWRKIPENIERQLLYLVFMKEMKGKPLVPCWELRECSPEKKEKCPAWKFNTGHMCWFINGTICQGKAHRDWYEKVRFCLICEAFKPVNLLLRSLGWIEGKKSRPSRSGKRKQKKLVF